MLGNDGIDSVVFMRPLPVASSDVTVTLELRVGADIGDFEASSGAAWRSCTGTNAHTSRPLQPRRRRPASTSSRALPRSPVTTPIVLGSRGRASCFWGVNSPSACSVRRRRSSAASRSPSPAIRSSDTEN